MSAFRAKRTCFTKLGSNKPLRIALSGALLCVVGAFGGSASASEFSTQSLPQAENFDPFTSLLTRRGPSAVRLSSQDPQLYATATGEKQFTFQIGQNGAFIRHHCSQGDQSFECALLEGAPEEEVFWLSATRSPRGDVIYKDDNDQSVLRVTATGGATLFSPTTGVEARVKTASQASYALRGEAVLPATGNNPTLSPDYVTYSWADRRMRKASQLLSLRHNLLFSFELKVNRYGNHVVLSEAIMNMVKALDEVASDELGKRVLSERLDTIIFQQSVSAGLIFEDGRITVLYNPDKGVSGRSSSKAIVRYLEGVL